MTADRIQKTGDSLIKRTEHLTFNLTGTLTLHCVHLGNDTNLDAAAAQARLKFKRGFDFRLSTSTFDIRQAVATPTPLPQHTNTAHTEHKGEVCVSVRDLSP